MFSNSLVVANQKNGVFLEQVNNFTILDSSLNGNGLSGIDNYSGIYLNGDSYQLAVSGITVQGNQFESNGAGSSGMGLAAVFSNSLNVTGNYFEGNQVFAFYSDATVQGLTFNGNYILGNQEYFGALSGTVHGNLFGGGTNAIQLGTTPRQSLDFSANTYIGTPAVAWETSNAFEHMNYYGTAAPASGTWALGDVVFNTAVSAGTPTGWVNI